MSRHGDYASQKLDQWQPRGLGGKVVKGVMQGARAIDRAATGDSHNKTGGDPYRCHMRSRRKGRECNAELKTRKQFEQHHCGHRMCAMEYTELLNQGFDPEYDTTHTQVRRW